MFVHDILLMMTLKLQNNKLQISRQNSSNQLSTRELSTRLCNDNTNNVKIKVYQNYLKLIYK